MNYFIKSFAGVAMVFFFISHTAYSQNKKSSKKTQSDFVKMTDNHGKNEKFIIKSTAKFDIQNGIMNISVLSQSNTLFEITGINENALKDTILKEGSFRLVYIRSQNEKTFSSNERDAENILTIKCSAVKKGNPVTIILKGKIFSGDKFYSIEAQLTGKIPEKRFISIQRTN